ncbi:hypothetical protein QTI66_10590 [Variovorax sp. J22R133]|uniref:hypothetical protein n=1 Tax=Variovorax brevis TaxID=3053503 RepID=UPI002575B776|nr:hypothetical protein [Variovorax sp. J22R133]MDM0112596.1 hypothetical protein [Variovorax sp. J22R133]
MTRTNFATAAVGAWLAVAAVLPVSAQNLGAAQKRYEDQLAYCNSGRLPDPERNACVRDAGIDLDRARGGPPRNSMGTTQDGRATIIGPAGLPQPSGGTEEITSRDGRATIVLPADQVPRN